VLRDAAYLRTFNLVHISPPCQAACSLTKGTNAAIAGRYTDIYDEVKSLMYASGVPGVIENPRARPDMVLCGEMFGLGVLRHRKFELVNWSAPAPAHVKHRGRVRGYRHGVWYDGPYIAAYGKGGGKGSVTEMQDAMGIHWTDVHEELTEAIPPAYTEYIARQFLSQ
jgi:DNA (cytosine-5)-methyltransferase 1